MATLTTAATALYPTFPNGGQSTSEIYVGGLNNRAMVQRSFKLTLTGQGGLTNTITAAALGFARLQGSYTLWDAQNSKGYPTVVDPVNNILILLDGAAAPAPVDVTSNAAYVTVLGITSNSIITPVT
jgi:hypothetical protein